MGLLSRCSASDAERLDSVFQMQVQKVFRRSEDEAATVLLAGRRQHISWNKYKSLPKVLPFRR